MAYVYHVFSMCKICKQTYIIAQKYAHHLMGDTGSTGRQFSMLRLIHIPLFMVPHPSTPYP